MDSNTASPARRHPDPRSARRPSPAREAATWGQVYALVLSWRKLAPDDPAGQAEERGQ